MFRMYLDPVPLSVGGPPIDGNTDLSIWFVVLMFFCLLFSACSFLYTWYTAWGACFSLFLPGWSSYISLEGSVYNTQTCLAFVVLTRRHACLSFGKALPPLRVNQNRVLLGDDCEVVCDSDLLPTTEALPMLYAVRMVPSGLCRTMAAFLRPLALIPRS